MLPTHMLRQLINNVIVMDSELDAFCIDHYRDIFMKFGSQMDRVNKINMLIMHHEDTIMENMKISYPEKVQKFLMHEASSSIVPSVSTSIEKVSLNVSKEAVEIIQKKQNGWNVILLAQIMNEELQKQSELRKDFDLGLICSEGIMINDFRQWVSMHVDFLIRLIENIETVMKIVGPDLFRSPHKPANPEGIVYFARKISENYRTAIEWALTWRRIHVPDALKKLSRLCAEMGRIIVSALEEMNIELQKKSIGLQDGSITHNVPIEIIIRYVPPDIGPIEREVAALNHMHSLTISQF